MKIKYIAFIILFFGFILQGCDLDRYPADNILYRYAYKNMQDAKEWDNGIYSTLRGKFGGGYILPQEVQADMLNAHAAFGNLYSDFHGWSIKADNEVIQEIYHSYYSALNDVNVVITQLPQLEVKTNDQTTKNHYLGNAYFARAFYYFNLAMRWGMVYNEKTADKDLGIILVTQPATIDKPKRATNSQTYKQILSDLHKADSLLSDVPVKAGNSEISADAVKALRARVYLYMGKMLPAFNEAKELIERNTYPLIPPYESKPGSKINPREDAFAQMWFYDNGTEQIWQPFVDKENEIPTTTPLYGADLSTTTYWDEKQPSDDITNYNKPPYVPTREVINDLFNSETDHRALALFEYVYTTVNDKEDRTPLFVISKFKGNPNYATLTSKHWGGYVPNGNQAPKPFRIAEQYLIASEAAYNLGDIPNAEKYLNLLRLSRGVSVTNATGEQLYQEIKKERSRELAYEGFRLWDLRRWKQGFSKRSFQGAKDYYKVPAKFYAPGFDVNIKPDNYMFIWPFPLNETQINTNIINNPGWKDK